MSRRRLPLVWAPLCLVVGACGSGVERGESSTSTAAATGTSISTASPGQLGSGSDVPTPAPGPQPATTAPDPGAAVDDPTAPASTADPAIGAGGAGESGEDFDPSFELGPEVVLDVDVVPLPVDETDNTVDAVPGVPVDTSESDTAGWAGFDRSLESALIRPGNTAASVAVSIGGELVHRAAFGVRDPLTGDPAEPQDRFRIASISKTITAIVAMQLVEDGVVGIDDPIADLVAEHVGLVGVGASQGVTLRRLLTHTSGFGKFQGTFFGGGATDCADAARQGLTRGAGGGGYVYSNMNYCVAAMAIEALTGLTYEEAAYRYLLTPLGISGMRLAPTFDPGPDEAQHFTTPGRNYMETLGGAGGWIATPSDLVTILDSLDSTTSGFKPLNADTVLAMAVPPGAQLGQRGYGLGIIAYGGARFGHTGTIESTHAMVLDRGDGVTWAITVAGQSPGESTDLERIVNDAFVTGGFVAG
jgi:D-alanyl-D-alanine carboxypeptidase